MRKYYSKLSVKIASVLISSISFLLLLALIAGILMISSFGAYSDSPENFKKNFVDTFYSSAHNYQADCKTIIDHHLNNSLPVYNLNSENLYTISIGDRVIESTYNGEDNYIEYTATINHYNEDSRIYLFDFTVSIYYPVETFVNNNFIDTFYNLRYTLIFVTFVFFILFAAALITLFCGAGHRDDSDTITLRALDKIPFDINTIILALLLAGQVYLFLNHFTVDPLYILLTIFMVIIDWILILNYFTSLVILVKANELSKRTLILTFLGGVFRSIKQLFLAFGRGITQLPLVWKTLLALIISGVVEFIVIYYAQYNISMLLTAWLIGKIILFPIVLTIALVLRKIQKAGRRIAEGDSEYRLDTSHMLGEFKKFGNDLNSISEGMGKAVEDKLKSERFKTELITNVSHDIKTPLTSIINYVDLIKKEKPENEKIREYTQVLDRQSSRLKKLIEDLIEASKASTGNLKVTLVPCELNVLLTQIIGEYEEVLAKQGLELVSNHPNHVVNIMADGRHLWRVIDNLMNNIRKYTMPGTRVYVSLVADDSKACITFRNISKSPLNISSEELMERFTRGDSSRNTEGSGLGLSIAKSLTEIQGGIFELEIDGDLFKAILTFDLLV